MKDPARSPYAELAWDLLVFFALRRLNCTRFIGLPASPLCGFSLPRPGRLSLSSNASVLDVGGDEPVRRTWSAAERRLLLDVARIRAVRIGRIGRAAAALEIFAPEAILKLPF